MKYFVTVKPNAKMDKVERLSENIFMIWVKAEPIEGKANRAVLQKLAEFLGVAKSRLEIKAGLTAKKKIIEQTE